MSKSAHKTQILVVGNGKLAKELIGGLVSANECVVRPWATRALDADRSIVVHTGSGRELGDVIAFCQTTQSVLMELSTGSVLENMTLGFPVILCPNTNVLTLKFMRMLEQCGHLFKDTKIQLTESHQAGKVSVPGTAVGIARSLSLPDDAIVSIRSPAVQQTELQIPIAHLSRHAYHQILISDDSCSLKLETRVYGEAPYTDGVSKIVAAIQAHDLQNRCYAIAEFIDSGWL